MKPIQLQERKSQQRRAMLQRTMKRVMMTEQAMVILGNEKVVILKSPTVIQLWKAPRLSIERPFPSYMQR